MGFRALESALKSWRNCLQEIEDSMDRARRPCPDYSCFKESRRYSVDRGVTLEERRHRRDCFSLCSALGTMFDLCTADLITNLPRLHLQGTTVLPSFRKSCTSIATLPRMIRARVRSIPFATAVNRKSFRRWPQRPGLRLRRRRSWRMSSGKCEFENQPETIVLLHSWETGLALIARALGSPQQEITPSVGYRPGTKIMFQALDPSIKCGIRHEL